MDLREMSNTGVEKVSQLKATDAIDKTLAER
jgi:hypothetical protein